MLRDEETKIVSHVDAGPGYRFLVLDAPKLAADLVPGQFVHVRIPGLEASALRLGTQQGKGYLGVYAQAAR